MDSAIKAGIELALSEYPLLKKRHYVVSDEDDWQTLKKVAQFLVFVNGVVEFEGVLHNANQIAPKSVCAHDGKFYAAATSSCGVQGMVRVVQMEDVLHGNWCEKCFPEAEEVQRAVNGL